MQNISEGNAGKSISTTFKRGSGRWGCRKVSNLGSDLVESSYNPSVLRWLDVALDVVWHHFDHELGGAGGLLQPKQWWAGLWRFQGHWGARIAHLLYEEVRFRHVEPGRCSSAPGMQDWTGRHLRVEFRSDWGWTRNQTNWRVGFCSFGSSSQRDSCHYWKWLVRKVQVFQILQGVIVHGESSTVVIVQSLMDQMT